MRYIGQSIHSLENKRRTYERIARRGTSQSPGLLLGAIREFGADVFEWSAMFDDVDKEELDQLEADTIAIYKTQHPEGYNRRGGGWGGKHSKDTLKKMSEVHTGKKMPPLSEEARKRMSGAGKKRPPRSEDHKRRLCEAAAKRKPPSEETRKKMSEAARNISEETRKKRSEAGKRRAMREREEKATS